MTKKIKEISSEQYLVLISVGIPTRAFGLNALSNPDYVKGTLLDMIGNPHMVEYEKTWAAREDGLFAEYREGYRYFTVVEDDSTEETTECGDES